MPPLTAPPLQEKGRTGAGRMRGVGRRESLRPRGSPPRPRPVFHDRPGLPVRGDEPRLWEARNRAHGLSVGEGCAPSIACLLEGKAGDDVEGQAELSDQRFRPGHPHIRTGLRRALARFQKRRWDGVGRPLRPVPRRTFRRGSSWRRPSLRRGGPARTGKFPEARGRLEWPVCVSCGPGRPECPRWPG